MYSFDLITLFAIVGVVALIVLIVTSLLFVFLIPDALILILNNEILEVNYGTGDVYLVKPKKDAWGNMFFSVNGIEMFIDTDQYDNAPITHWGAKKLRRYYAGSALPTNAKNSAAITQIINIAKNTKTIDGKGYEYPNIRMLTNNYEITNLATCKVRMLKELIPKYTAIPKERMDEQGRLITIDEGEYATQKALKQLEVGKEVARLRQRIQTEILQPTFFLLPVAENATQLPITPTVLKDTKTNLLAGLINKSERMAQLFNYVILGTIAMGGFTLCLIGIKIFILK